MGPRSASPSVRLGPGGLDRLGGVLHAARTCRGGAGSQRPRRHPRRRRPHRQSGRPHGGRGPGAGGFRGATHAEHGSRCCKAARHRDRGTGWAHRRSSPAPGILHRDRGPGPRSGQLRGAPGGLPVVHRRGTSGRRRRLAGHRCLEPRPHHGGRPPVRRSEHDSRRVDSRDARRGRAAPPRSGCECRTRRTPSRLARPLAGGSPETMAARHLPRRHLPFRRPPGSAFS